VAMDKNITIAPNPNNGRFNMLIHNMEGQKVTVEIVNILGITLHKTSQLIVSDKEVLPFEIQHISSGNYFVKVLTEHGDGIIKKLSITE
jgi:hypothetical protein